MRPSRAVALCGRAPPAPTSTAGAAVEGHCSRRGGLVAVAVAAAAAAAAASLDVAAASRATFAPAHVPLWGEVYLPAEDDWKVFDFQQPRILCDVARDVLLARAGGRAISYAPRTSSRGREMDRTLMPKAVLVDMCQRIGGI
eukprot:6211381-Pleurochrysis_carterae.AAC.1